MTYQLLKDKSVFYFGLFAYRYSYMNQEKLAHKSYQNDTQYFFTGNQGGRINLSLWGVICLVQ